MHFCAYKIVQYPGASRMKTRVVHFSDILDNYLLFITWDL